MFFNKKYRLKKGSSKLTIRFKTEEKIFDEFLGQNYSDKVDLNFTKSERAKRVRKKITIP